MYYAPHTLHKRSSDVIRDERGFAMSCLDAWDMVSECRCDEADTQEITDRDGNLFRPSFHIVAPACDVVAGDYVRVPEKGCEGVVRKVRSTNYLDYTEIWV